MATSNDKVTTIAFVLYPGLTVLDAIGPLQVMKALESFAPQYRCVTVAETMAPFGTDVGIAVIPDTTFRELPEPSILVVPGGSLPTIRALTNPALRKYVSDAAESAEIVASVCTGALILASVGLLTGRPATTHWIYKGILETFGARYVRRRWVEDGKFIMSAGVSAGIDMALYLTARLSDEATARQVQLAIDYDPEPPLGRIDWDRLGVLRAVRSGLSLAAPLIARTPKRLTASEHAARSRRR